MKLKSAQAWNKHWCWRGQNKLEGSLLTTTLLASSFKARLLVQSSLVRSKLACSFKRRRPSSNAEGLPQTPKAFLKRRGPSSNAEGLPQTPRAFLKRRGPSSNAE